jgi:hypothetical protein
MMHGHMKRKNILLMTLYIPGDEKAPYLTEKKSHFNNI